MKETKQLKEYKAPQFQFVKQDERNRVFFAASGTPEGPSHTGGINKMNMKVNSVW